MSRKLKMIKVSIECDECLASCAIIHELDEEHYEIEEQCPFCLSDNITIDITEQIK